MYGTYSGSEDEFLCYDCPHSSRCIFMKIVFDLVIFFNTIRKTWTRSCVVFYFVSEHYSDSVTLTAKLGAIKGVAAVIFEFFVMRHTLLHFSFRNLKLHLLQLVYFSQFEMINIESATTKKLNCIPGSWHLFQTITMISNLHNFSLLSLFSLFWLSLISENVECFCCSFVNLLYSLRYFISTLIWSDHINVCSI